jgi:hypothetical protein
MAVTTGGRVRTATGTAVIASLILVLAFGNPAYVSWSKDHASNGAWGYFLRQLAWPEWSFNSDQSIRTLLANDIKAILLIVFTGLLVSLMTGAQRGTAGQFFDGWGSYVFAGALGGLIAAFVQANATLLGAFNWAAGGAVYGLFTGWILGLASFGAKR